MRKSILVLLNILFINVAFAQSYREPLNKLNSYLQNARVFVKQIEVKDGYFYIYKTFGDDYQKMAMKDLGAAVDNLKFEVTVPCLNDADCVSNTEYKFKNNNFYFYITESGRRSELTQLLNNFISAYDKDFGIAFVIPPTTGCMSGDCINGSGKFIYPDTSICYCNWKNGKLEGKGYVVKKDGTEITGKWENDEIIKGGKIKYPDKYVYEGGVKNNLANGEGILTFSDNYFGKKFTLKGNFVNGKISGKGEYYYRQLDTKYERREESYTGDFKDGLFDGYGTYKLTSHFPKAVKKGLDNIISYEGEWKKGKKNGTGKYYSNHVSEAQQYTGEWKNDLKNGKGICQYITGDKYDDVGLQNDKIFDGTWLDGYESVGKLTTNTGRVLYDGGKKERDAYWTEASKAYDFQDRFWAEQWEKGKQEREERAERNAANAKKECTCDKCGGTGKISTKSLQTTTENKFDATGHEVKSTTTTAWVYGDQLCSRCLGTGKCK